MNQNLDFVYSASRWFSENPEAGQPRSDLQVPLICEFMPMRWSYEAIVFAQAKLNPLTSRQEKSRRRSIQLARRPELTAPKKSASKTSKNCSPWSPASKAPTPPRSSASCTGLTASCKAIRCPRPPPPHVPKGVSAERLYVNQKTTDLVNKAEMEQSDYRETRFLNVFFGPQKRYFGLGASVLVFNAWVLIPFLLVLFQVLYFVLRQQLKSQQL